MRKIVQLHTFFKKEIPRVVTLSSYMEIKPGRQQTIKKWLLLKLNI